MGKSYNKPIEQLRTEYLLKYMFDNGLANTELYKEAEESLKRFEKTALYERFFRERIKELLFFDNLKIKPYLNLIIHGDSSSGKTVLMNHIVNTFNDNIKHIEDTFAIDPFEIVAFHDLQKWHLQMRKSLAIDDVTSIDKLNEMFEKYNKPENLIVVMSRPTRRTIDSFKNNLAISKNMWGKYEY